MPMVTVPQTKNYKKWLSISLYVFFVLTCQALSTILCRLYYENGGKSTWTVTVLQRIGFPVLFLYRFFSQDTQPQDTDPKLSSYTTLGLAYISLGLLASAISYMSSVGLLYLPASTFSLIFAAISSQVYTIGAVGLIFESSSVFSNTVTAIGLPIVPVVAVIVFHDKMDAFKIFSIILAIWGFLSFVYQHYLDEKKLQAYHATHIEEETQAFYMQLA